LRLGGGPERRRSRRVRGRDKGRPLGRLESFELEYPCHSPTERRWFIGRVTPYLHDEKPWAVVAHENITKRRLAEEALKDQKLLLETILGQAADAIIVCDEGGGSRSPTPRRGAWRCGIPKAPRWR
jgi:PAS domain-containing protein